MKLTTYGKLTDEGFIYAVDDGNKTLIFDRNGEFIAAKDGGHFYGIARRVEPADMAAKFAFGSGQYTYLPKKQFENGWFFGS